MPKQVLGVKATEGSLKWFPRVNCIDLASQSRNGSFIFLVGKDYFFLARKMIAVCKLPWPRQRRAERIQLCESHAVYRSPQLNDVWGPVGGKQLGDKNNEGKLSSWRPSASDQLSVWDFWIWEVFMLCRLFAQKWSPTGLKIHIYHCSDIE